VERVLRLVHAVVAEDLVDDLERGFGVEEREAGDGLAVPARRGHERDLLRKQAGRPRVVVGAGPTAPPEQDDRQLGIADELEVGERADPCRGRMRGREHPLDRIAVRI
jgi:hypothetical protein